MIPIRRRLYQSQPGFSPRQLFAALQGAWLEPTPGFIWQENTGINPTVTGGQTIGRIADQSGGGNNATQATAGNRPAYQLDSNGLPLARHDATDSLIVSLPAINVRRNLLTYSEQFDNAAWTKTRTTVQQDSALAPDNTGTADKIVATTENGTHIVGTQTFTVTSGLTYTFSVSVKAAGINSVVFRTVQNTAPTFPDTGILANLTTGAVTTDTGSPLNAFAIAQNNGYWRIGFSCVATGSGSTQQFLVYLNSRAAFTGDGTSGIYIWGAQLELGSAATDYQRVTDWASESYSSNGSVYFSTPVGMSALHKQSMGTTYTLPALSTDIYSWIVVPQRLNTAIEGRLERYMLRKANLSEPDYLLDDDGNPLMSDDYELLLRQ